MRARSTGQPSKRPLALAALLCAGLASCGGGPSGPPYVQFANGFDFAVTATITSASGAARTLEIPSKGRVGAELAGVHTIEFVAPDGTSMEKKKYKFADRDKRTGRCQEYVNVLGSAAIVEEEIIYGAGMGGGGKLLSGYGHTKVCPRWGFETAKPPESVTVKQYTPGIDLTWLHYVGDGDWVASISSLLGQTPQMGDQARIRAWNLAVAVSKHDPENPRLAPLGPMFMQACHTIVDMFTEGPLAGNATRDCLANTKALFPDA